MPCDPHTVHVPCVPVCAAAATLSVYHTQHLPQALTHTLFMPGSRAMCAHVRSCCHPVRVPHPASASSPDPYTVHAWFTCHMCPCAQLPPCPCTTHCSRAMRACMRSCCHPVRVPHPASASSPDPYTVHTWFTCHVCPHAQLLPPCPCTTPRSAVSGWRTRLWRHCTTHASSRPSATSCGSCTTPTRWCPCRWMGPCSEGAGGGGGVMHYTNALVSLLLGGSMCLRGWGWGVGGHALEPLLI